MKEYINANSACIYYGAGTGVIFMTEYNNWEVLVEAHNDVEADIICGFLQEKGIPARKADSSPYAGAMRVIGGQALEVHVLVPEPFLEQAADYLLEIDPDLEIGDSW